MLEQDGGQFEWIAAGVVAGSSSADTVWRVSGQDDGRKVHGYRLRSVQ